MELFIQNAKAAIVCRLRLLQVMQKRNGVCAYPVAVASFHACDLLTTCSRTAYEKQLPLPHDTFQKAHFKGFPEEQVSLTSHTKRSSDARGTCELSAQSNPAGRPPNQL